MYKTDIFQLTPQLYFRIAFLFYLKKKSTYLLLGFCAFIFLFLNWLDATQAFSWLLIVLGYIIFMMGYFLYLAYHPENRNFYRKRWMEFDEREFASKSDEGIQAIHKWNNIVKIHRAKNYYLLFLGSYQFFYIPYSVFLNQGDRQKFEKILAKSKV